MKIIIWVLSLAIPNDKSYMRKIHWELYTILSIFVVCVGKRTTISPFHHENRKKLKPEHTIEFRFRSISI